MSCSCTGENLKAQLFKCLLKNMVQECCGCSFPFSILSMKMTGILSLCQCERFAQVQHSCVLSGDCESFTHDFRRLEHLSEEEATALLHKALGFTWLLGNL